MSVKNSKLTSLTIQFIFSYILAKFNFYNSILEYVFPRLTFEKNSIIVFYYCKHLLSTKN